MQCKIGNHLSYTFLYIEACCEAFLINTLNPPTEILKAVRNNEDVLELLKSGVEKLEPNCLNNALVAAVKNDHHQNVGTLIATGANNILEALKEAVNGKWLQASAMLMLISAATDGNCNMIRQLFEEIAVDELPCQECSRASGGVHALISKMLNHATKEEIHDCLRGVCNVLRASNVPTAIPIQIARRSINTANINPQRARRCTHVREELLMKTNVNKDDKSVDWQLLGLRSIELSWLKRINWVKSLLLGRNQLKILPAQMGIHLKQVYTHMQKHLSVFFHVIPKHTACF